jgi:hypothetical protein
MEDEQERARQWSQLLSIMRQIGGSTAILLLLVLLALVILNQVPPLVLLLALGPAILWMTTWIWEGRPPKSFSIKDPARVGEEPLQRLRTFARRELAIGMVLALAGLVFALLQIWTSH